MLKGSGVGPLSGITAAGRGNTWVVTSEAADKAGAGGRHRAKPGESERVSGRWESPAGESSRVGGSEGGRKASGMEEKPREDCQGVGGRFESPRDIDTPGLEELPQGDETSGVTPEGYRVPGEGEQGWGGDGNLPTTR